jgi:hypothetical protein
MCGGIRNGCCRVVRNGCCRVVRNGCCRVVRNDRKALDPSSRGARCAPRSLRSLWCLRRPPSSTGLALSESARGPALPRPRTRSLSLAVLGGRMVRPIRPSNRPRGRPVGRERGRAGSPRFDGRCRCPWRTPEGRGRWSKHADGEPSEPKRASMDGRSESVGEPRTRCALRLTTLGSSACGSAGAERPRASVRTVGSLDSSGIEFTETRDEHEVTYSHL